MDDKEIVSAVRASLADKVGRDRFDLWFGASTRLVLRDDTLLVELPNRFAQDWVRSRFRREIEAACHDALHKPLAVEFRIDASLGQPQRPAEPASGPSAVAATTATLDAPPSAGSVATDGRGLSLFNPSGAATPSLAAATTVEDGRSSCPDVLNSTTVGKSADSPIKPGLARRRFATLDEFAVGTSNRFAHASAHMVAEQPGRYSPLLVYGPTGVGKTHLLEGIWCAARKRRPGITAVYLSAEQFTTYFLEALRGSGLPSFRRKYRGVELLIVDGLQFFAGKRATLVELLHTTDTLLREGRQLVFAADRAPAALAESCEELATRLSSGMVCGIDPPDFQTRLDIVRQLATRRGLNLADDVTEFVAMHLSSHARELSGAINRLDAAARILRSPITRALAEEALTEMIRHTSPAVRLADIDRAVCQEFGLEVESLQSGQRGKSLCQPRMLAMWLARKHTRAALSEIGRHFGRRSHSTVVSAQKTVNGWVAGQSSLEMHGKAWNVEDAIRRIEQRLRTA